MDSSNENSGDTPMVKQLSPPVIIPGTPSDSNGESSSGEVRMEQSVTVGKSDENLSSVAVG